MNGWTNIEQVGRMAVEALLEGRDESSLAVTFRRVETSETNGPRWTASVGTYSSKATRTPEEALEEVAGMLRGELLCRIEHAEKRIKKAREALPTDTSGEDK